MLYNSILPFFNNKININKNLLLSENEKNFTKKPNLYNLAKKNKQFFTKKFLILFCEVE